MEEPLKKLDHEWDRNDRDLLIRLETKLDQLTRDVKDLKDGTSIHIAHLEQRMDAMETIRDQYDPKTFVPMILSHEQWIHDYKLTKRLFLIAAGAAGGGIPLLIKFFNKTPSNITFFLCFYILS